ncbi:hypothetical protein ACFL1H_07165 [Nanoarchaeota archaeon]
MTVDERILQILDKGNGRILAINNDGKTNNEKLKELIENAKKYRNTDLELELISLDQARDKINNGGLFKIKPDLIIIGSRDYYSKLLQYCHIAKIIKDNHNDIPLGLYLVRLDDTMLLKPLHRNLKMTGFEEVINLLENANYYLNRSLIEVFDSRFSCVHHDYYSKKDADFVRYISESFMDGNSQTKIDYKFLIINDRVKRLINNKGAKKFKVIGLEDNISEIDFNKYLAVFLNNSFDNNNPNQKLGDGINVLERLNKLNLEIPIIYQSAFPLEEFSEEEKNKINNLGGILMPKNSAFKICKGKLLAEKEIYLNELISNHDQLRKYTAKIEKIGEKGFLGKDNQFIISSRQSFNNNDLVKQELFNKLNIEDDVYSTRMYVLSMFHTLLKDYKNEKIFRPNVSEYMDFFDIHEMIFESVEKGIGCNGGPLCSMDKLSALMKSYTKLARKHKDDQHTVLAHYDSKPDNWFPTEEDRENNHPGIILGDCANTGSGTEYRDVARSILDKETDYITIKNPDFLEKQISNYIKLRIDQENQQGKELIINEEEFKQNVIDHVIIESIRISAFQAIFTKDRTKVNPLLDVATHYVKFYYPDLYEESN